MPDKGATDAVAIFVVRQL